MSSPDEVSNGVFSTEKMDPVVLEVGNHVYKTTVATLKKIPNTYFSAMMSGQYPLVRQPDGSFFVDRDGKHFGSILSFMRSGYLAKPQDRVERKELLLEAEYYCIKDAIVEAWVRFYSGETPKLTFAVFRLAITQKKLKLILNIHMNREMTKKRIKEVKTKSVSGKVTLFLWAHWTTLSQLLPKL